MDRVPDHDSLSPEEAVEAEEAMVANWATRIQPYQIRFTELLPSTAPTAWTRLLELRDFGEATIPFKTADGADGIVDPESLHVLRDKVTRWAHAHHVDADWVIKAGIDTVREAALASAVGAPLPTTLAFLRRWEPVPDEADEDGVERWQVSSEQYKLVQEIDVDYTFRPRKWSPPTEGRKAYRDAMVAAFKAGLETALDDAEKTWLVTEFPIAPDDVDDEIQWLIEAHVNETDISKLGRKPNAPNRRTIQLRVDKLAKTLGFPSRKSVQWGDAHAD